MKMKLTQLQITDDFPVYINLCGKSVWKSDENQQIYTDSILDRKDEKSFLITTITGTELKPSDEKNKLMDLLYYFFPICDEDTSPQNLWCTADCGYRSLMLDYQPGQEQQFDRILTEIMKRFPELKNPERLIEKIPDGKHLKDVISMIEIAYPATWDVEYER